MSVDIKDYIEDWLSERIDERASEEDMSERIGERIGEEKVSERINDIEKIGKLEKIGKHFKKLNFDEKWNKKLLSNRFNLFGTNNKRYEKYLTLEMALYNSGQKNLREGGLKRKIMGYINDLTQWEFLQLLDEYKVEKSSGKFTGRWDPFIIKNKRDFIREFKSPHFTLENDSIMINLISKILGIDFIILHQNYCIQDLTGIVPNDKLIILYKFVDSNEQVYVCLVGLSITKKVVTKFDREKLPEEIRIILNKDEFIFEHIKKLISNMIEKENVNLTLNFIINELESTLCSKFSHNEIRGIIKITNDILKNVGYFE